MDRLIIQASQGEIHRAAADLFCQANGMQPSELWNSMALSVAKAFQRGKVPFRDADAALNAIWSQMVVDAERHGDGFVLPEPAYSIYQAFDAGEYDHGDNEDPVKKYTRQMIEQILEEVQQGEGGACEGTHRTDPSA